VGWDAWVQVGVDVLRIAGKEGLGRSRGGL
jgi:hypothetical protein